MTVPQILLIEDTESVREVLARQLTLLGADVVSLQDGQQLGEQLHQAMFDMVITDFILPDCTGIDIAWRVREAGQGHVKIILLSGDHSLSHNPDVVAAAFDHILMKPVCLEDLQDVLRGNFSAQKSYAADYDETGALDLHSIREQMGELDEISLIMLSRFPGMMRPLLMRIFESAKDKNFSAVFELAHSLKGAARSAGAVMLGDIAEIVQQGAQHNQMNNSDLEQLSREFERAEYAIAKLTSLNVNAS
jgi:two-component system sensor histidine kinase/response regulator